MLYFPNVAERHNHYSKVPEAQPSNGYESKKSHNDAYRRPTQRKCYENTGQPLRNLRTLDDIRQLYKSVPNFGALDDSDSERPNMYVIF